MKHLIPLVMMQLKDKLDFSFLKSRKQTISKIVFKALGFIAVTAACYMLFYISQMLSLFALFGPFPQTVIVFVFTIMMALSIVSCTFGLMKSLYMSTDNQVLLTLPVKPNMVFISKLIIYYIYELLKNLFFMIPIFVAFGLINKYSLVYYPWLLFWFLFISMVPVLIGALISLPVMFMSNFLKQIPYLSAVVFISVVVGGYLLAFSLISTIPENIDIIANWGKTYWDIYYFLNNFSKTFLPFTYIVKLLCGAVSGLTISLFNLNSLIVGLVLIMVNAVMIALSFVVSRPFFFKMASKPFEYKRRVITKKIKNKTLNKVVSSTKKEIVVNLRTPNFIYNYLGVVLVLPLAIFLLNKIFAAMNTRLTGAYAILAFNILIILLIMLVGNVVMASAFSKEGRAAYLTKTRPSKYLSILTSKLFLNIAASAVSLAATIAIFNSFANIGVLNCIWLYFAIYFVFIGHLLWSAELDLMNPQNEQYATVGNTNSNPNENKSSIFAFLLSFVIFGFSWFLISENVQVAWFKVCLVGLGFMLLRIYLYVNKIKIYYKEK